MISPAFSAVDQAKLYYDAALKQYNEKKLYVANRTLCEAIDVNPNYLDALRLRANVRNQLGNYVGAIQDIDKALTKAPNDGHLYYLMGISLFAMQNYPDALDAFNKAVQLNYNDADVYTRRGYCKCILGRVTRTKSYFSQALPDFEKSISLEPGNPDPYLYRGMAKAELNGANAGLKDIEYALNEYKRKGDMDSYNRNLEIYKWIKNEY